MKNNKIIIVFSGKQFSGKDTVCKILLERFKSFKRIGIADAIKLRYSNKTGLSLSEIEKNKSKYRQDLIDLGNWGRAQNPDFWLKEIADYSGNTIVTDVRMKHELDFFRKKGAYTIRIEASLEARSKRGKITALNDETETALDDVSDWDFILFNEGCFDELKTNTEKLVLDLTDKYGENI